MGSGEGYSAKVDLGWGHQAEVGQMRAPRGWGTEAMKKYLLEQHLRW